MPSLTTIIGVPTGPYFFNDRPRIEETYINRDKEMIKEIRRKSIKDGMKQPLLGRSFRETRETRSFREETRCFRLEALREKEKLEREGERSFRESKVLKRWLGTWGQIRLTVLPWFDFRRGEETAYGTEAMN